MSPDEENAVLSQEDIDAMLASSSDIGSETQASVEAEAAQSAAEAPTASDAGAAPAPSADGAVPSDIVQRLEKLEAAVSSIGSGGGDSAKLEKQLKALTSQLDEIRKHLPNTLGYGIHETFQCGTCNTKGLLAGRVICTQCGTDTFVGWYPQK